MNKNESLLAPEALKGSVPNVGMKPKWKIVLAFSLGASLVFLACIVTVVLSAMVGWELGTVAQFTCASFIGLWVCFFITQFFLSYGNPRAICKDWPVIAALNFAPFCSVILLWAFVTWRAALAILVVAGITLACSCAGAALAALTARRRLRVIPPALG
jgi:hypothetical protein